VFDRFARSENDDQSDTGLEMAIIKEEVEQMGGSIEVQSEEGKGTSFYLSIPCESDSLEKKSEIIV
jgi:signal transduction histidine kinase